MKRRCRLDRVVNSHQLVERAGRVQRAKCFIANERTKAQPVHSQDEGRENGKDCHGCWGVDASVQGNCSQYQLGSILPYR